MLASPSAAGTRSAPVGPSDAALVVAARAGEHWAFEALYRRHADLVHGLAYRLTGGGSDVDDVVQDTFVQAFHSLDRLEDPSAFRSWLWGVTVRTTGKLLRRHRLLARLGLRKREAPIDFDTLVARDCPPDVYPELRALYATLREMPADVRVALVLRRVEGHGLEDIATSMGISLATVKRRLAAGEKLLAASREAAPAPAETRPVDTSGRMRPANDSDDDFDVKGGET
jgi:RNA polymerase sigma-70 factor (ECF subfamily)